ncbi:hypothetical protein ACLOJK_013927 [Asimina triloba]
MAPSMHHEFVVRSPSLTTAAVKRQRSAPQNVTHALGKDLRSVRPGLSDESRAPSAERRAALQYVDLSLVPSHLFVATCSSKDVIREFLDLSDLEIFIQDHRRE